MDTLVGDVGAAVSSADPTNIGTFARQAPTGNIGAAASTAGAGAWHSQLGDVAIATKAFVVVAFVVVAFVVVVVAFVVVAFVVAAAVVAMQAVVARSD